MSAPSRVGAPLGNPGSATGQGKGVNEVEWFRGIACLQVPLATEIPLVNRISDTSELFSFSRLEYWNIEKGINFLIPNVK